MDKKVGITSTVPVEVIYAAGRVPVDLNNLLLRHADPAGLVSRAEAAGLPRNVCAWTKGVYQAAVEAGIKTVVGVVEGDCSNTRAVMERMVEEGFEVIPFAYPYDRSRRSLEREIGLFAERLGAAPGAVAREKKRLDLVRRTLHEIDTLTWREGKVSVSIS